MDTKLIEVLKQEVEDWKEALSSYKATANEEIADEGTPSYETQKDISRAEEKISALQSAISICELFPELVGALEDLANKTVLTEYNGETFKKARQLISKAKAEEIGK
jgi:hypothetical protein